MDENRDTEPGALNGSPLDDIRLLGGLLGAERSQLRGERPDAMLDGAETVRRFSTERVESRYARFFRMFWLKAEEQIAARRRSIQKNRMERKGWVMFWFL